MIKLKSLLSEIDKEDAYVLLYDRVDGHIYCAISEDDYQRAEGHHVRFLSEKGIQLVNERKAGLFFSDPPSGGLIFWPYEDAKNMP